MNADAIESFERERPHLLALAYRMLGDFGRAEELVQDTWTRWQGSGERPESDRALLVTIVTRLCLNELGSARVRREIRPDRLPEPVDLARAGLDQVELLDRISMAFLVLLQRLGPAERAALLLHEVFDFSHAEIAGLLNTSEQASRQLLRRARMNVAEERRCLVVSDEDHRRLLRAFVGAAADGDLAALQSILADDVVLVADAGKDGARYGGVRNLPGPLSGREKVAAFVASVAPRGAAGLEVIESRINAQPALVVTREGRPVAVIMIAVVDGRIRSVFMHADPSRLIRVASPPGA